MSTTTDRPAAPAPAARHDGLLGWLTTTDHKRIGILYAVTSFGFFLVGGAMAGVIRAELATPGVNVVGASTYNQLFTIHGSVMVFLFAVPFAFAIGNYLVPLQVGAPDMAFPRLNALSYWLYLFGGLIMLFGFLSSTGAADFGWTAYPPLSDTLGSPGVGADLWIVALIVTGVSGTLTAVNLVVTIVAMRIPGMTMFRMPILTWNLLLTCFMVLLAFPVLTGALAMLLMDRLLGAHFFDPAGGGQPILWQHLFWFFGHPEVYIVALPYFGVITEVIPVFSRRPIFGYKGLVLATITITALSTSVWAHHMFATGAVYLPFFTVTSSLIAIPTGVKFFNWTATMWGGSVALRAPMLFALAFMLTFLIGGLTGVMLAAPGLDFHVHDTHFVVAHLHYVMGGTVVFAVFAAIYFWWPKVTGRRLDERLGRWHVALLFVGFNLTFFFLHEAGLRGMARRVVDYPADVGLERPNLLASIGVIVLTAAFVPFALAVWRSLRAPADNDPDPWEGNSLEWITASPPPPHNFDFLPPIRSERPVFDLRWLEHPSVGATGANEAWLARQRHDESWRPVHRWADEPSDTEPGEGAREPDDGLEDR